jgi:sugar lactone lactonase YvrE
MKKIILLLGLLFNLFTINAQFVCSFAGSGTNGFANGTGNSAVFSSLSQIAIDNSGNIYIADSGNHRIRKITSSGVVSTLAGSGVAGFANGTSSVAKFWNPSGVAVDSNGNVYVADTSNHLIRKITTSGVVSTFAGTGSSGYADGTIAQFNTPLGLAVDTNGNVYVADQQNYRVRKITPAGVVSTLAGSGINGFADGIGTAAKFSLFEHIAVDAAGNIYVADDYNNRIRKITSTGTVTTIAGSGASGYSDGIGTSAVFANPIGISVDASGVIYVSDFENHKIRKILPSGVVSTLAGSTFGYADGNGSSAKFYYPFGIAVDLSGNVFVADSENYRVRKITNNNLSATISYTNTTFCSSSTSPQNVTLTGTGAYTGGVYSSTIGLTINATSGAITPSSSTPGIYTVTYNTPSNGGCQISATAQVTITAIPTASINYTGSPFCKSLNTAQSVTLTGKGEYTGGTFSSTTGLSINASTGAINPSLSTAGTYTVTYTTPASVGCASISTTRQVTITAVPTVSFNYSGSPFCKSLTSSQPVTLTGTGGYLGGTFSSYPLGLSMNNSTGAINPSLSTAGFYTVNYTTPSSGGCAAISNLINLSVSEIRPPSMSYSGNSICQSVLVVSFAGFGGGVFSSTAGLSINSSTGNISRGASTPGNYTVTYTTPPFGGCTPISTTTQVVILPTPITSISADETTSTNITINSGNVVQLQLNGSLGNTSNIQWTPNIGINSTSIANPLVYPNTTNTYTASFINSDGCRQSTSITVNVTPRPNIGTISLSSPNTGTIGLFDTITVNVQLTNATDLYGLYMKLKGNSAVSQYLDYKGYDAGNLFGTSNVISTPPTIKNGVPDFGMTKVGTVSGYSGTGLFYTFKFAPKNISIPDGTIFCFYLDDVNAYNSSITTSGLNNQGQICFSFTNQVMVWPGDLNKSKMVTTADLLPIGYFYNSTGPVRPNATILWTAQPASLWGYNRATVNGSAYKTFADSNGDGVINNADQAAIGFNMNQTYSKQSNNKPFGIAPKSQNSSLAGGELIVTPISSFVNGTSFPETITFSVSLNNKGGLSTLYGISVNLIFDNTVFDLSTAKIDYIGSIFGIIGLDSLVLNYNSTNAVSVGLTRFNNSAINGQGLLFKVTLKTKLAFSSTNQTTVTAYVDSANNQAGENLVVADAPLTNLTFVPFTLPYNNFTVETKSETCASKNNGQIIINAAQTHNYFATINGTNYNFENNSLSVSNLAPGVYTICISVTGEVFQQCYSVTIGKGGSITGKSSISSNKALIEITSGTAPFEILVNGTPQFESSYPNFSVDVKQGDLLEVKTAIACEGIFTKTILDGLVGVQIYPNPTSGLFEIAIPTSKAEVEVELYSIGSQLISKRKYPITNQKVQLSLENQLIGVYIVKINLATPVSLIIVKK